MSETPDSPRPRSNLFALTLTRLVIAASGVVANVALIELMPREAFGAYRLVWAVVVVAAFGANLGLGHYVAREVARAPEQATRLVALGVRASAGLSLLTSIGVVGWFVLTRPTEPTLWWAAAFGAGTLATNAISQIWQGAVHGLRRMSLELPGVLASRALFVLTQVGLAVAGYGLVALYAGRFVSGLALLVAMAWAFRREVGPLDRSVAPGEVRALLGHGRVFGATVLFSAISAQADIVMLGLFADDVEVARYGAPAAVLLQLAFVANIFSRGFFPRTARLVGRPDAAGEEVGFLLRVHLLISLPIAIGGVLLARPLVMLFRDGAYADAWAPFVLLLVAVPVRFVTNGLASSLTALDRQRARARIDLVGAGANVALNLVAIPLFGAEGAAATTLVTDLLLLGMVAWVVRGVAHVPRIGAPVARAAVAAVVMGGAVVAADGLHVLLRVAVGAAVYPALVVAFGAFDRADLRRLRRV